MISKTRGGYGATWWLGSPPGTCSPGEAAGLIAAYLTLAAVAALEMPIGKLEGTGSSRTSRPGPLIVALVGPLALGRAERGIEGPSGGTAVLDVLRSDCAKLDCAKPTNAGLFVLSQIAGIK